jgi:hypothetical protein
VAYAYWDGSFGDESSAGQGLGKVLANIGLRGDKGEERRNPMQGGAETPLMPPGGILIVALLSGVFGAVVGLILGGYLTIAFAVFVSLTLGLTLGIWVHRTGD